MKRHVTQDFAKYNLRLDRKPRRQQTVPPWFVSC